MKVCFIWYTGKDGRKRYLKDEGPVRMPARDVADYSPVWTDDLAEAESMEEATAREIARALPRKDDMVDGFEVSPD